MNASRDNATTLSVPVAAAPPVPEISELVATTLGTILGNPIGLQETFWEAGGTSLAFIDLAARLEDDLGIVVRAEDVMENDTPVLLGKYLHAKMIGRDQPTATDASAQA